jgi:hypothetical protein
MTLNDAGRRPACRLCGTHPVSLQDNCFCFSQYCRPNQALMAALDGHGPNGHLVGLPAAGLGGRAAGCVFGDCTGSLMAGGWFLGEGKPESLIPLCLACSCSWPCLLTTGPLARWPPARSPTFLGPRCRCCWHASWTASSPKRAAAAAVNCRRAAPLGRHSRRSRPSQSPRRRLRPRSCRPTRPCAAATSTSRTVDQRPCCACCRCGAAAGQGMALTAAGLWQPGAPPAPILAGAFLFHHAMLASQPLAHACRRGAA